MFLQDLGVTTKKEKISFGCQKRKESVFSKGGDVRASFRKMCGSKRVGVSRHVK